MKKDLSNVYFPWGEEYEDWFFKGQSFIHRDRYRDFLFMNNALLFMNNVYCQISEGSSMAILQVRDIDDRLYATLKAIAKSENRSISQEVISILEKYLSNPSLYKSNPTREFIALSGSWDDYRKAEEIVHSLRKSRKNSKRFHSDNVLFD